MFIKVEKDIIDDAIQSPSNLLNHSAEVLIQLAMAVSRRAHLVLIISIGSKQNSSLAERLAKVIGENNVRLFQGIYEKRSLWGSISAHVDKKVIVTINKKYNPQPDEIVVNPNILKDFRFERETVLLTENIDDAIFFKHLVLYYERRNSLQSAGFSYYPINGGGGTLYKVLDYEMKKCYHLCLAITDSDQLHPDGDYGQTYKNAKTVYDNYKHVTTSELYKMDKVAEIENLIPYDYLYTGPYNKHPGINIETKDLSFYDIKYGLKSQKLYEDPDAVVYWEKMFPEINFSEIEDIKKKSKNREDFCKKNR